MKQIFIASLFFSFLVCNLFSQNKPAVDLITVNDGLSQGMIFDIQQCKDGFIWLATNDGLNRYDGARFEAFAPTPFNPFSIAGSIVESIFEDHRGLFWVCLPGRLDVFDPKTKSFFHIMANGKPVTCSDFSKVIQTADRSIWLIDAGQIWKIDFEDHLIKKALETHNSNINVPCKQIPLQRIDGKSQQGLSATRLYLSKQKELFIGTNQGLFNFDFANQKLKAVYELADFEIRDIAETPSGDILIIGCLQKTISRWILVSGNKQQIFNDTKYKLHDRSLFTIDEKGYLWTFRGQFIQKWQLASFFEQSAPLLEVDISQFIPSKDVYATKFLFDRSDILWIGTNGYGFLKMNVQPAKFRTYEKDKTQRKILEAPDGGFYCLEFPQVKYASRTFEAFSSNIDFYGKFHVNDHSMVGRVAVSYDQQGNGWSMSCVDSFLYRMDAQTKSVEKYPWSGNGLLSTRNGELLSVNETGLRRFNIPSRTSTFFPFKTTIKKQTDFSNYMYEDSEGVIWIFGFEGLTKAIPTKTGYDFQFFRSDPANNQSLSNDFVLSLVDDPLEPEKYLWIGTKSGGLNRFNKKTKEWKHYSTENGLPDNVVYGVLAEKPNPSKKEGYLWMSTNKGLCRFDVRAETTKNFTAADGLQDNEFNTSSYLQAKDGYMIFGGVKGLNVFHPDSLKFNTVLPQIRIVGIEVNNKKIDLAGQSSFTFAHNQNLITFDFAALEFTNPAQNQYRYKLVGVDNDWVALGNKNSIQFANLAPGSYVFNVEGSNNDGVWSGQIAELHFRIRSPWWSSWWAYLIYFTVLAASIWFFNQYRFRQKLEHQENLRLKELDEFKSQFFTSITHEFRTPITVVLGITEQLEKSETEAPKLNKLGMIKRNGENLLRLINQILDLSKLESKSLEISYIQSDVLSFIRYLTESLQSLANTQNVMLKVESDQNSVMMDYDPDRLLQIVHNLLANAIKFTPSGGKVVLQTELKDKWLHLSVTDTGVGIPQEALPHLFTRFFQAKNQTYAKAGGTGIGLSLTAELVKALGGTISVESTLGKGSTFLVKLPITNNSMIVDKSINIVDMHMLKPTAPKPAASVSKPIQASDDAQPQVLIIEDNIDVVEYLESCLEVQYQLDFAYNGKSGIEKALETIPDLIVSDVMMPEKDGFEVLEALKNDERTSHIPIILLTAKADVQSRLAGLRRGADVYMSKPFHQEELLVTIANLLEVRRKLQEKYNDISLLSAAPDVSIPKEEAEAIEDVFLQKLRAVVEANLSDADFEMPHLERALAMSRSQIFRKVKALTGKSPSFFIRSIRLHHGRHLLKTTDLTISEIAYEVGYAALNNFSDAFMDEFGERPSALRG